MTKVVFLRQLWPWTDPEHDVSRANASDGPSARNPRVHFFPSTMNEPVPGTTYISGGSVTKLEFSHKHCYYFLFEGKVRNNSIPTQATVTEE